MKLRIDFDRKIIALEDNINLGKFIIKIKEIIPDWQNWTLETNVTFTYKAPITISQPYTYPYYTVTNLNSIVVDSPKTSGVYFTDIEM